MKTTHMIGVIITFIIAVFLILLVRRSMLHFNEQKQSLHQILLTASVVDIRQYIGDGITGGHEITIDRARDQKLFSLLQASKNFHSSPHNGNRDYLFIIDRLDRKIALDYVSATGELGRGNDWCYVPRAFNSWIIAQKAKIPTQRPLHIFHGSKPYDPVVVN